MAAHHRPRALVLLAGLLVASCSSPPGLELSQSPQPTKVDLVSRTVWVASQPSLRPSDADAIRSAVNGFAPPQTIYARLVVAGPVAQRRASEASLRRALTTLGVPSSNIFVDSGKETAPAAQTEVTFNRYVVTPTGCRNFQLDFNQSSIENPKGVGIGCSQEKNLSLMVEDPRDLLIGRTQIGPADSEREAIGLERYRADQVKTLLTPERLTTK